MNNYYALEFVEFGGLLKYNKLVVLYNLRKEENQ